MERRYDIDWLRVIAIGLLLIYHIAIVFQPWAMFIGFIRSAEAIESLWTVMLVINIWRIPLLFFVSGMGVYFAIRRRNWKELLLDRTKRILIPFIFGTLAIAPLHMLVFQGYYHNPLTYFPHPGHLWFLANIFIYVILLAPLFFYLKRQQEGRFMQIFRSMMGNPLGSFMISLFFIIEVLLVKPQIFELYALNWHGFFLGLLAFLFGFLFVLSGKKFWEAVSDWRWLYLFLGIGLYILRLFMFEMKSPTFLMAIESHSWILAVLGCGYRYLNQPSNALRYLSKAAYPIYIIHMAVLYLGTMLILPLEIPVILKFIGIVVFTGLVCYLLYEYIIKRLGVLSALFGLKWESKKSETSRKLSRA